MAKIGLALGMKVIFNNRSQKETGLEGTQVDLETLLSESDLVSINCPLTNEKSAAFGKKLLYYTAHCLGNFRSAIPVDEYCN